MRHRAIQSFLGIWLGATLVFAGSALATDSGSSRTSGDPWTLNVTPYGWLPFLNGDQTIKGRTVSIDVNPIEVLEHLDAAPWMSYVEARKGRKLGVAASSARSIDGLNLNVDANVKFEQAIIEDLLGSRAVARGGSVDWVDPLVVSSAVVGWPKAYNTRFCTCSLCGTMGNAIRVACVACTKVMIACFAAVLFQDGSGSAV